MESGKTEETLTEAEVKSEKLEDHTSGATPGRFRHFNYQGISLRAPVDERITEKSMDSLQEEVDKVVLSSDGGISSVARGVGPDDLDREKVPESSYQNSTSSGDCSAEMFQKETQSGAVPDSMDAHVVSSITSVEERCQMKNDEDTTVCGNISSCSHDLEVQRNRSFGKSCDYPTNRNSEIFEGIVSSVSSTNVADAKLLSSVSEHHNGIQAVDPKNHVEAISNPADQLKGDSETFSEQDVSACKAVEGTRKKALKKAQRTRSSHKILVPPCLWIFMPVLLMGNFTSVMSMSTNVAVAEGVQVILRCSVPKRPAWVAYDRGSSQRLYISTADGTLPLYSLLHESDDQYDLSFNAAKSTGKRYLCIDQASGDTIVESEVIVLDAEPNCVFTVNKYHINASCNIKFTGDWAPTLHWERWIGDRKSAVEYTDLHVSPGEAVTSTISMKRTASTKNEATSLKWKCVITFTESGRPSNAAGTNIPEYNHTEWIIYGASQNSALLIHLSEVCGWSTEAVLGMIIGVAFVTAVLFFLCGFFWKKWIHPLQQLGTEPDGQSEDEKQKSRALMSEVLYEVTQT